MGYIRCGVRDSTYIKQYIKCDEDFKIISRHLDHSELEKQFPFLNFSKFDEAIYEENSSGYISPRRLIAAHRTLAKRNGCDFIDDIAKDVNRLVIDGQYIMCVTTDCGRLIHANKVLLATGAFTSFRSLLPDHLVLNVELAPITVARVEIDEEDFKKIQ